MIRLVHSELREAPPSLHGFGEAPILEPRSVARIVGPIEVFGLLLLNGKHVPFAWCVVSQGTLTGSLVHPREVFGPALRLGAAAVVVVHNHPSGDPTPSREDRDVTRRLDQAGELLGVPLLDHVVIGRPHGESWTYCSVKQMETGP